MLVLVLVHLQNQTYLPAFILFENHSVLWTKKLNVFFNKWKPQDDREMPCDSMGALVCFTFLQTVCLWLSVRTVELSEDPGMLY